MNKRPWYLYKNYDEAELDFSDRDKGACKAKLSDASFKANADLQKIAKYTKVKRKDKDGVETTVDFFDTSDENTVAALVMAHLDEVEAETDGVFPSDFPATGASRKTWLNWLHGLKTKDADRLVTGIMLFRGDTESSEGNEDSEPSAA